MLSENLDEKQHVHDALEAASTVDSVWSKGEHTFAKMPSDLLRLQRAPIPDVNKGFFELKLNDFKSETTPEVTEDDLERTKLLGDEIFYTRDYVFDNADIVVERLGLRVPAFLKPLRHTKTLTKRLMHVNKKLGTDRDLVNSFPLAVDVDFFETADDEKPTTGPQKETQVVCTMQVVNFVGKGKVDRPENDSYLSLTQERLVSGKKGVAAVDLDKYKPDDEIEFFELKKGDLWPIEDGIRMKAVLKKGVENKASATYKLADEEIVFEELPMNAEGGHNVILASSSSDDDDPAQFEGEHDAAPKDPRDLGKITWDNRPKDEQYSGQKATVKSVDPAMDSKGNYLAERRTADGNAGHRPTNYQMVVVSK